MDFDENSRPRFTDAERSEIAAEHDRIADGLWPEVTKAEKAGNASLAIRLCNQACDAMDVAEAACKSSAALARLY